MMRSYTLKAAWGTLFFIGAMNLQAQPLSGELSVGESSDITSLTALADTLTEVGVGEGGLIVTLEPGTYTENLILAGITGLSAENRLTIQAENPGEVTIAGQGTTGSSDAAVRIDALSYITLRNLSIADNSEEADAEIDYGIHLAGTADAGCQYIEIKNCSIFLGRNGEAPQTTTRGIYINSAAASPEATNSNNLIDSTFIDNCAWGIQIRGRANLFSGEPIEPDSGNTVRACVFGSQRRIGHPFSSAALALNAAANKDLTVTGNVVDSVFNTEADPILPISNSAFSYDNVSGTLTHNRVNFVRYEGGSGSAYGVRASVIADDTLFIANNFFSNISRNNFEASTTDPSLYAVGIWIFRQTGGGGLARILHNSTYMEADEPLSYPSAGIHLTGGSTGLFPAEVENNIVINRSSTTSADFPAFALVEGNSDAGYLLANNNLLLADGENGFAAVIGRELGGVNLLCPTADDWNTNANASGNVEGEVEFEDVAGGDLHLAGESFADELLYTPALAEVPVDIDYEERNPVTTQMGAHEGEVIIISTDDRYASFNLEAYPNPTQGSVWLSIPEAERQVSLEVFDLTGKLVLRDAYQTGGRFEISLSNLPNGLYTLRVASLNGASTQKLIKR